MGIGTDLMRWVSPDGMGTALMGMDTQSTDLMGWGQP